MIEVTAAERAAWAEQLANRPSRHAGAGIGGHEHSLAPGGASESDIEDEPTEPVDEWDLASAQVFAVASGKGGVGKSTITANLAAALAQKGLKVGVLDADLNGFSMPRMLGVQGAACKSEGSIVAPEAHGVKMMSLGMFTTGQEAVIWRGPVMNRALQQFLTETDWGDLDVLFVDLPPGTGDVAISIAKLLPQAEILLVTTPQLVAAEVAARAGAMTLHTHQRVRGIIENMAYFDLPDGTRITPFGEGGGTQVAQTLTKQLGQPTELLAQIPLSDEVRKGSDAGIPVVISDPDSAPARAVQTLANLLVE
ncbi:MAG: Mrp/NBP35 family ATP-binding protein [Cellulomonadaceae bacterium]|jgi:ATP-binding protein involved in chromosome partitioning|nr:Mrp/NBP35 family ATP-binding protein [Cellulomonadaceae bacterium]